MGNFNFIKSNEKRKVVQHLEEEYGITDFPVLLIETGKQKLRAFTGSLSKEEIMELNETVNVELIGMYTISRRDDDMRLNFDAIPIYKDQITKNILEINEDQYNHWIRGYDLDIKTKRGIVILKFGEDLVGFGKSNTEKIFNYIPKERKLKTPLPKKD